MGAVAAESGRRRVARLAWFCLQRIALGILTLFLVSVIVFAATQALPGDAARSVLGRDATPERLAEVREQLNLDRSAASQYWSWLSGVLTGDFGTSLRTYSSSGAVQLSGDGAEPIGELLGHRIKNSAYLVFAAAAIAFPLAILIGAVAAYRRDRGFDHINSVISVTLAALPDFVIALTLVLLLSTTVFQVLPAVSLIDPNVPVWQQLDLLVLPVLALVIYEAPYVSRIVRASMIEVLESDYVEMARLKGLSERKVVVRHALPNAIVPTIQVIAVQFAVLAGGIVVIEFIFGFPGIGLALVDAVMNRDIPVIQAVTLLIAAIYVVVNMLADIATVLLSPRLRTSL
jgi:peptide/nickel transport system permease protein